jgi:hypothetical protein
VKDAFHVRHVLLFARVMLHLTKEKTGEIQSVSIVGIVMTYVLRMQ